MEYYDEYNPNEANDFDIEVNELQELKSLDRGYSKIYKNLEDRYGKIKRTKIEFYISDGIGSNIRDAITGEYLTDKVGSLEEDLYFKTCLATGECNSKNGLNKLFYSSPDECENHLFIDIDEVVKEKWRMKKSTFKKGRK